MPEEFQVHTMGGSMSGENKSADSSQGALNNLKQTTVSSQGSSPQQKPFPTSSSPLPKSGPMGGGIGGAQSGPSQPFTGAPASSSLGGSSEGIGKVGVGGGMGSGGVGSGIQTMGGMMQEDDLSGGSSKKLLKIFIGVFVVIVLVGGAIFGVFMLKDGGSLMPGDSTEEIVEEDLGLSTETPGEPVIETPVEAKPETTTTKVRYSDELLNYLSIDVESETVLTDIKTELDIIRKNLPSQNFSEPITFIITNKQNKPISFGDFAVKANMSVPADVLLALEDRFEIYAFNDFSAGVRFGFRVDVKNETALIAALDANSATVPSAVAVFFKDFELDATRDMTFKNGSYKDYAVKYLNLNEAETYSVDYAIKDGQWILGTSQKTLRTIIDKLDENKDDLGIGNEEGVMNEEGSDAEVSGSSASSTTTSNTTSSKTSTNSTMTE